MEAGDRDRDEPLRGPFTGFSTNADDTPRELEFEPADDVRYETDRYGADRYVAFDPWEEDEEPVADPFEPPHEDLRFARGPAPAPAAPATPPPTGRSRSIAPVAAGVVALALAAGAGLMLTRGDRTPAAPTPVTQAAAAPAAPVVAVPPAPTGMNVEVAAIPMTAAPPPPPPAAPRMETLPQPEPPPRASMARRMANIFAPRQARPPVQAPAAAPRRLAVAPPPPPARVAEVGVSSPAADQAFEANPEPREEVLADALPPRPSVQPAFNCRYARTRAEMLVCNDSRLAAADRRLNRAYEAAIAAGVPRRDLREEQDDWLGIREQAARVSPQAVLDIYHQRTDELEDLAQGPPE